jgi:hypothetical protein
MRLNSVENRVAFTLHDLSIAVTIPASMYLCGNFVNRLRRRLEYGGRDPVALFQEEIAEVIRIRRTNPEVKARLGIP